ncbi:general odorant-binding protein 84a-like [Periplaneta americana]|uniref:general odorant-binding protein 84a-like n=1 Tax=Periplaneta americana TaxID=6978 RepID=UPI0037E995EE
MLKIVIAHFVVVSVLVFAHDDDTFNDIREHCNETFQIPHDYDNQLVHLGSFPDESDKTPMCFVHCVMDKSAMMDAEGTFDSKVMVEKLQGFPNGTEYEDLQEMIDNCITENAQEDLCERSYGFAKCLMTEEIKRHGESAK